MIEPISTAISALVGFGAAAVNGYIDLKKQRENNKHALDMHKAGMVEYQMKARDEEHKALLQHDSSLEGFRASVRPVLTYSLVGASMAIAIAGIIGWIPGFNAVMAMNWLFNAATATICYWFGQRNIEKNNRRWFT